MGKLIQGQFKKRRYFAIVGPGCMNVKSETVYGIGYSRYSAFKDAHQWTTDEVIAKCRAVEIDAGTYARIEDGEVGFEALCKVGG